AGGSVTRAGLVVVLVCGCADRVPLADVPIRGGTASQRAVARRVMDAFDRDAGEGRVDLRELAFDPLYGPVAGRYHPIGDRIQVDPDVRGPELERVVRHELCHA